MTILPYQLLQVTSAQAYLTWRQGQIDVLKAEELAYGQADALRDLLAIQRSAMERVCVGRIVRKVKWKDPETGKEVLDIEYEPVMGMRDPHAAIAATIQLLRVQGKHADQKGAAGIDVSVRINTAEPEGDEPVDVTSGKCGEETTVNDGGPVGPPESFPKVVYIPRNTATVERGNEVGSRKQTAPPVIVWQPSAAKGASHPDG